ncbi:thioredoxin fold domain-containing protein [bacterium]|nr:thioredoxin fold domain-containing protein [bacterium]
MAEMITVTAENFDREILQSDSPAAVMFKSVGCPHCAVMKPGMEKIAGEYAGRLKTAIADVIKVHERAIQYGILSVPQVLFFKGGEKVDEIVGAVPKSKVVKKVKRLLEVESYEETGS